MCACIMFPRLAQAYQDCCFDDSDCCSSFDLHGLYLEATGGVSWIDIHRQHRVRVNTNTGYFVSGAIGYRWCYGFRTEAEVGYHRASLRSFKYEGERFHVGGHTRSISYMANLYYDLPFCFWVTPYVGGGIGYAQNRFNIHNHYSDFSRKRNGFAWQVMAGLEYDLCNLSDCLSNWSASIEYRYYRPSRLRHTNFNDLNFDLRYNF